MRRQLPQYSNGCRLIVDEHAAFAANGNFAADDQGAVFRFIQPIAFESLLDRAFGRACTFEYCRNHSSVCTRANYLTRCLFTQQQRQGVDQDGLARAGFSGQQVQAGPNSTAALSMTV